MVQQPVFASLLENSHLFMDHAGPSRIDELIIKLLEVFPGAAKPVLDACMQVITKPSFFSAIPVRLYDFFDILALVAKADPKFVTVGEFNCLMCVFSLIDTHW